MEGKKINPVGITKNTKKIISTNINMNINTLKQIAREKKQLLNEKKQLLNEKKQLIHELLHNTSLEDIQMLVDYKKKMHTKTIPTPRKSVNQMAQEYEDNIIQPPLEFRDRPIPMPITKKTVKQMTQEYEDNIIQPPLEYRDDYNHIPRSKLSNEFNFDDDLFSKSSNDQPLFNIIATRNTANKKFNSYTNEYKITVRKNVINNKNDIYNAFEKMLHMTIKKRQLGGNDRIRIVISNDELTSPISTKMLKVSDFKLKHLMHVIDTLDYKEIDLENCKIIFQSV